MASATSETSIIRFRIHLAEIEGGGHTAVGTYMPKVQLLTVCVADSWAFSVCKTTSVLTSGGYGVAADAFVPVSKSYLLRGSNDRVFACLNSSSV